MKRNRLGIIAAVVIAAIATVVLVVYVRDAKESAVAGEKLVDVVVASEAIKAGTAATDLRNATTMERIPAKTRPDGALQSLKQVEGLVTSTDLVASEVLLQDRFVSPGQVEKGVASVKVPAGYVEVTLKLDPEKDVGGQVKPGSLVAVFFPSGDRGTELQPPAAVLAFHDILVSNTQFVSNSNEPSADDTKDQAPTRTILVTVAVDDSTAERIVHYTLSDTSNGVCNCYLAAEGDKASTSGTGAQ